MRTYKSASYFNLPFSLQPFLNISYAEEEPVSAPETRLSPNVVHLFSLREEMESNDRLRYPSYVSVDETSREIYVVDSGHSRIVYKYENGQYLFEFGGKGWRQGWFQFPSYIYIDHSHRTLVADTFNQRIQVLKITALKTIKDTEEKILVPGFLPVKLNPEKGKK